MSFKSNIVSLFCWEAHTQLGVNIGLNSKQLSISPYTDLEELHWHVKHSPQRQLQISSRLLFSLSSIRLIITTQQVSVFVMKKRMFFWDYSPHSMNPSVTLQHLVKTVFLKLLQTIFQTDFFCHQYSCQNFKISVFSMTILSSSSPSQCSIVLGVLAVTPFL